MRTDISGQNSGYVNSLVLRLAALAAAFLSLCGKLGIIEGPAAQMDGFALPVFCFLLAEGAAHTSDRFLYARRLLIFALLAEIPYNRLMFGYTIDTDSQNPLFTMLLAYLLICAAEAVRELSDNLLLILLCEFLGTSAAVSVGRMLSLSYASYIIPSVVIFYIAMQVSYPAVTRFAGIGFVCSGINFGNPLSFAIAGKTLYLPSSLPVLAALLMIHMYNGRRGPNSTTAKVAFYLAYPAMLMALLHIK